MKFEQFGISADILKSLEALNYTEPTPVQEKCIPKVLEKQDVIVISKTGSGKTGAFGIPMLHVLEKDDKGPKGLILTPTRELAVQVDQNLKSMSKFKPIGTTVVYGGHSMQQEIDKLSQGVEIVTGTPGRVFDHIMQGHLKTQHIEYLVLDEADRMLDMGFLEQVQRIIKRIPQERVTMLFSATMPPEIQKLCKSYMRNAETIEIESETKTVDSISQFYYKVDHNEKRKQLHRILTVENPESCMIFCNTRITVDRVNEFLYSKGYASKAIHGANTQSNRMKSIQQFKKGDFEILVATDVAARGIHVDDLSLVVNYDVPQDKDSYVHRIGRTGRAGNGGRAITLVTKDDLYSLYEIEEHVGSLIEELPLPTDEQVSAMPQRTPRPKAEPHGGERSHKGSKPQTGAKPNQGTKPHQGAKPHQVAKQHSGTKPHQGAKPPMNQVDSHHTNKPTPHVPKSTQAQTRPQPSNRPQPSSRPVPSHDGTVAKAPQAPKTTPTPVQAQSTYTQEPATKKSWISKITQWFKK